MCGIAGAVGAAAPVAAMIAAIRHRGPDGDGLWSDDHCRLGHARLRVLDVSDAARQPMVSACGTYVIVFNGEIYNFQELRRRLAVTPRSASDTEILLEAFAAWGEDCLAELNGMFAFAVWDRRRRRLFAARDRMGVKPFYFAETAGGLLFASEIKGLLAAGVPPEPDMRAVHQFLRWGALDHSEATWFRHVRALPPGACLSFADGRLARRRWWNIADAIDEAAEPDGDGVAERFGALLEDSLRLQTVADRRIGVHLSGGVDSTVVTVLAKRHCRDLPTYTFGYREPAYDERPFAAEVAGLAGLGNAASVLAPEDVETLFLPTLWAEDEPFTSFRQLSHHKLYADFKADGATVVLEASGGDEVGAGYTGFLWPLYLDLIDRLGPGPGRDAFLAEAARFGLTGDRLLSFALAGAANDRQYGICTSDGTPFVAPQLLVPGFDRAHGSDCPDYPRPFRGALRNAQYLEAFHTKLPRGLRYVERASSASGREARVPLLDHRIVALGFAAANSTKIRDGQLRWFMKRAVRGLLPESLLARNKRSVADPQGAWIRGPLSYLFELLLQSKAFRDRGIFDPQEARRHLDLFHATPGMNSLGVYQMLVTEAWFRIYVDGDGSLPDASLSDFLRAA